MSRALKRVGVGGGIVDTVMETWHSVEAIYEQLKAKGFKIIQFLVEMDEVSLVGDVALIFVLIATWVPIFAMSLKRVAPSVEIPILSLGVFGSTVNSILISKYAASAFYSHYHGAENGLDLINLIIHTDDAAKLGLLMYAVLFAATWVPSFVLIRNFLRRNKLATH